MLLYDLRIFFVCYVVWMGVVQMKRFDIGCVYCVNCILGVYLKEFYECVFDIVISMFEDFVFDVEVFFVVVEIIKQFLFFDNWSYYIRINYIGIMRLFLIFIGIFDER